VFGTVDKNIIAAVVGDIEITVGSYGQSPWEVQRINGLGCSDA
jgi:hypothetical protein